MTKIAICDDEEIFRTDIVNMVSLYLSKTKIVYSIDVYCSGTELLEKDDIMNYNIIFLDINMEGINGIDTAKKIRMVNKEVFIVFITAFLDYSLEGYKVDAIRYLLKDCGKMEEAINECLDAIFIEINRKILRIKMDFLEGYKALPVDSIIYIESNLHKLIFYVRGKGSTIAYTQYNTLNKVQDNLPQNQFIRIHQSYLVNLRYIKNIKNYRVMLKDGTDLPTSKSRYKEACNTFILYKGSL